MNKRIAIKTFKLSREALELYLIKTHDLPEDIVVTNIGRPLNQEVWLISVQSKTFEPGGAFTAWPTDGDDLLK